MGRLRLIKILVLLGIVMFAARVAHSGDIVYWDTTSTRQIVTGVDTDGDGAADKTERRAIVEMADDLGGIVDCGGYDKLRSVYLVWYIVMTDPTVTEDLNKKKELSGPGVTPHAP